MKYKMTLEELKNKVELEQKDPDSFKKSIVQYIEYLLERKVLDNKYTEYLLETLRKIEIDEEFGTDIVNCSNLLGECIASTIEASEKLAEAIDKVYKDDIQRDIKINKVFKTDLDIDKLNPS